MAFQGEFLSVPFNLQIAKLSGPPSAHSQCVIAFQTESREGLRS